MSIQSRLRSGDVKWHSFDEVFERTRWTFIKYPGDLLDLAAIGLTLTIYSTGKILKWGQKKVSLFMER